MDFVLLKTFSNYIEANMALSMLEQEGINCHLEDENTVTLMAMSSGVRLMVFRSQAHRAVEVLMEAEKAYLDGLVCPNCNHAGFEIKMVEEDHEAPLRLLPFGRLLAGFAKLFSKEGTIMKIKHYQCINCKKEFEDLP